MRLKLKTLIYICERGCKTIGEKRMNKLEFKKAYALYRQNVSNAYCLGLDSFRKAINSSVLFRTVYLRDVKPVSIRCRMALSDAGFDELKQWAAY